MHFTIQPFGIQLDDPSQGDIRAVAGLLADELDEPGNSELIATAVKGSGGTPCVDRYQSEGRHTSVRQAVTQVINFLQYGDEVMWGINFDEDSDVSIHVYAFEPSDLLTDRGNEPV
jgi:hypothetical protein